MTAGGRARRAAALLAAVTLLTSGCGSRRTQDEIVAANSGRAEDRLNGAASRDSNDANVLGAAEGDAAVDGGPATGRTSDLSSAAAGTAGAVKGEATSSRGTTATKSPIRIASVSTLSGPAGAAQSPGVRALQVWAKWVNAKGGINGHPVELFIADDGSDPARHAAAVRDMVENKKVIAFVNQWASQTHQGAGEYLARKRVPVIGGEATNAVFWSNPMYFPQSAHFNSVFHGTMKSAARFIPGRNFGSLVCRESQICEDAASAYKAGAGPAGFKVVYEEQGSLAQPDFTGECLAARNADVDLLAAIFDANSVKRVARSCSAQGFKPTFVIGNGIADGGTAKMPEFDGAVGVAGTIPFVVSDTPATREFHDAYRKYAPNEEMAQASMVGWVSAKLFERVAQKLGDQPATEQVLDALWSLKNEDLGGLTGPMTFAKDKPAPAGTCYFPLRISGGRYVAPDGARPTCG